MWSLGKTVINSISSLMLGLFRWYSARYSFRHSVWCSLGGLFGLGLLPTTVYAQNVLNSGDSAWVLTASALVLLMTLPGLALFYGGLVRSINVLSVMMQCCAVACVSSVLWLAVGYSIAFGDGGTANAWFGGFGKSFLAGVGVDTMWGTIPEVLFCLFQMTFAIITPALIIGAYVERIKFVHVVLFSGAWLLIVYAPVAHWIWGGGFLADLGVLDFAGGLVVHTTAGIAALVMVAILGPRHKHKQPIPPHSPGTTMLGATLLWVGWYGFNGGSALAADGSAAMAIFVTHIAATSAALVWVIIESVRYKKPSLIGLVTGLIAGLASITPASGYVGPVGGMVIGLLGGVICYLAVNWIKFKLVFDDSLDVFAVHGVGGILGTLLTAIFGATAFGGVGLDLSMGAQMKSQLIGVVVTVAWTALGSWLIVLAVRKLVGLRVDPQDEAEGLDYSTHGESSFHL